MESSNTAKRALIAELAFSLFVERKKGSLERSKRESNVIAEAAWRETEKRLIPYVSQGVELTREFSSEELREIEEIARSLFRFFAPASGEQMVLRPVFSGCGYIGASEGDVILGTTIYEVKTVERPFRSHDVRQVIMYAALNFASGQYPVSKIGMFNPRSGLYCDVLLDFICREISGLPAQEFLALIVQTISSGDLSR